MGASIGAKPAPLPTAGDEAPVAAAPPANAMIGNAPRRRQKKTARQASTADIDPSALAQFAATSVNPEVKAIVEEAAPPVVVDAPKPVTPVKEEAKGGLLLSSPSPEPVKEPTPEPVVKAPTPVAKVPTPEPVKAPTPVAKVPTPVKEPTPEPVAKTPTPVKEPTPEPVKKTPSPAPAKPENQEEALKVNQELEKELASVKQERDQIRQQLSDYDALTQQLTGSSGDQQSAETLAVFLAPKLEQAEGYDALVEERDSLKKQLEEAKQVIASANPEQMDDARIGELNTQLVNLQEERDRLLTDIQALKETVKGRDAEIVQLKSNQPSAPAITVASLSDLEADMQARFKQTADFIAEMEQFLQEHGDV